MLIFSTSVFVGLLLGFGFGVGCALAVMYSIFMGGYRAALKDVQLTVKPERYHKAMRNIHPSQQ